MAEPSFSQQASNDDTLDHDIDLIRTGWVQAQRGRVDWIEGSLKLIQGLTHARQLHQSNREFHQWLLDNDLDYLGKDDRAALLNIGTDLTRARQVFEESGRHSYQMIWRERGSSRLRKPTKTNEKQNIPVSVRHLPSKERQLTVHVRPVTTTHHTERKDVPMPATEMQKQSNTPCDFAPNTPYTQKDAAPPSMNKGFQSAQINAQQSAQQCLKTLETLANGTRWSDKALAHATGSSAKMFLLRIRLIPWLSIERTPVGTVFMIDQELRDICDGRQSRPQLDGQSIRAFLTNLRTELDRRRKEMHDKVVKTGWITREFNVHQQRELLDWVEAQLATIQF